jgi:hypothetical protein
MHSFLMKVIGCAGNVLTGPGQKNWKYRDCKKMTIQLQFSSGNEVILSISWIYCQIIIKLSRKLLPARGEIPGQDKKYR